MISTDEPSFPECKLFCQEVWDKKLLIRAGAIQIRWEPLKEADYLSISLWKEWAGPSAFSIVFRAKKKGKKGKTEQELIELNCRDALSKRHVAERGSLTSSKVARPKAYEKQDHQYLHLNLDPTSVASQVAAPKRKHEKLTVEFDDEDGECTQYRSHTSLSARYVWVVC